MLDTIRHKLEQYEGQWMLPDDLDALLEIIGGAIAEGPEYAQASAVAEIERLRADLDKWKERAYRNSILSSDVLEEKEAA